MEQSSTDHNPYALTPCATGGEEVTELGLGRSEGLGKGILTCRFIYHCYLFIYH